MRAASVGRSYNNKLSVQPDSTNLSVGFEGLAGGNSSFEYYIDKGGKVVFFFFFFLKKSFCCISVNSAPLDQRIHAFNVDRQVSYAG